MSERPPTEASLLQTARTLAAGMVAAPLLVLGLALFIGPTGIAPWIVSPAALIGLVSPVIGWRLYLARAEAVPPAADAEQRARRFLSATLMGLGVGEGAATFGAVAYWLSGDPFSLIGVLTHLLIAGAVWPTPERLERFLDGSSPPGGER